MGFTVPIFISVKPVDESVALMLSNASKVIRDAIGLVVSAMPIVQLFITTDLMLLTLKPLLEANAEIPVLIFACEIVNVPVWLVVSKTRFKPGKLLSNETVKSFLQDEKKTDTAKTAMSADVKIFDCMIENVFWFEKN